VPSAEQWSNNALVLHASPSSNPVEMDVTCDDEDVDEDDEEEGELLLFEVTTWLFP
jgi:hypothetical protein